MGSDNTAKRRWWCSGVFWAAVGAIATILIGLATYIWTVKQTRRENQAQIAELLDQAEEKIDPFDVIEIAPGEPLPEPKRRELAAAGRLLDRAYRLGPKHPETLALLGVYHAKLGQLDDAEKRLSQALARNSRLARAHCALGVILKMRNALHLERAIEKFEEARKMDPQDPLPYFNLGIVQREIGLFAKAAASFENALEHRPKDPDILVELGTTHRLRKDLDQAIQAYRKAVAADPVNASALYHLGEALWAKGEIPEASAWLQKAIDQDEEFKKAYPVLGVALAKQGRSEEALNQLQICLHKWGDYGDCHEALGLVLYERGETEKAIAEWDAAVRLDAADPEPWRYIVEALRGKPTVRASDHEATEPDRSEARPSTTRVAKISGH